MEDLWVLIASQFFGGLTRAAIYFLISSGLSLIFGVMDVINFAHGAFYMLGAFLCYSCLQYFPPGIFSFFFAVLLGALILALVGGLIELTLLRRTYSLGHVPQILLTYGLALAFTDVVRLIWGGRFYTVSIPEVLEGFVSLGNIRLPTYNLFLIIFALSVYLILQLIIYHSRLGMIIRAIVYNREMVSALGIDASKVFLFVLMLGISLSGLAGGLYAPLSTIGVGMDIGILVESFAIVIIGGVGNLTGTLLAALIVGEIYAFAILLPQPIPQLAQGFIFIFMILILLLRPYGLKGSILKL